MYSLLTIVTNMYNLAIALSHVYKLLRRCQNCAQFHIIIIFLLDFSAWVCAYCFAAHVRLTGGKNTSEGRVEVYHNGTWGAVCDDGWDIDDAGVVCKQLGFPGVAHAFGDAYFGLGDGTIWLMNLICTKNNSDLSTCSHDGWSPHKCTHGEDAGVVCHCEYVCMYSTPVIPIIFFQSMPSRSMHTGIKCISALRT